MRIQQKPTDDGRARYRLSTTLGAPGEAGQNASKETFINTEGRESATMRNKGYCRSRKQAEGAGAGGGTCIQKRSQSRFRVFSA